VAANANPYPHLTFHVVHQGRARLTGGGKPGRLTRENNQQRPQHAQKLRTAARSLVRRWHNIQREREEQGLPALPAGRPLILQVDDSTGVDFLRTALGFEVIAEEEGGFVLVASEDLDFERLNNTLTKFLEAQRGGGSAAKLYDILDVETSEQRLARILSEPLLAAWPRIADDTALVVDISVSCVGDKQIADFEPQREAETAEAFEERKARHLQKHHQALVGAPREAETDAAFAERKARYLQKHQEVMESWDEIQRERESEVERLIAEYDGEITSMTQEAGTGVFHMPDSITVRARISGKCFKDLAQNHPHVFQISDVEPIDHLGHPTIPGDDRGGPRIIAPELDAPAVCIIDSGIEEGHVYINPAIVAADSRCFIPGTPATDTADYVRPNGHGTRVAGAVLYPTPASLPVVGVQKQLPCWIHNARVLNEHCQVPEGVMPALYIEHVIQHYHDAGRSRPARIFNHSINSRTPFRSVHMSTWAAAIDKLSFLQDVLVIQSAGNIVATDIAAHMMAGRQYPQYQLEASSRVRNPGQSLSALTVGSVAHTFWEQAPRASIARAEHPSSFSPAGAGIWGSIKPDVVEYGGDLVVDPGPPAQVFQATAVAHELPRSTMHGPGATSKDEVGTSFAAPKVTHIAAILAKELPNEPCLLYRALIANSARWPAWAEGEGDKLAVLRRIGYGIPDIERATTNTEHRVSLVTSGAQQIPAREAHIFHIRVPDEIRSAERDHLIRIDVTLSYAALPRRTRRRVHGYLATRLSWDVSKKGESMESFQSRVIHDADIEACDGEAIFNWMLRERTDMGAIIGITRQNSTLQKDWCNIRSHELPADFCIAVMGHPGWDPSPESKAKYSLVVSFEAVNRDLRIYEPIRVAIETPIRVEVDTL
jgi:hypothetical protein